MTGAEALLLGDVRCGSKVYLFVIANGACCPLEQQIFGVLPGKILIHLSAPRELIKNLSFEFLGLSKEQFALPFHLQIAVIQVIDHVFRSGAYWCIGSVFCFFFFGSVFLR